MKKVVEDEIEEKLKYLGLDLNNVPETLKIFEPLNYRTTKKYEENKYRQYRFVPIKDIEILNSQVDKIMKKAITMLCKLGAIKIISMDINLNFEIIKYALDTKIMELEKIKLYFEQDEEGLLIRVFDKDIIEKQGRKKVKLTKNTIEVKLKRKIKLFT